MNIIKRLLQETPYHINFEPENSDWIRPHTEGRSMEAIEREYVPFCQYITDGNVLFEFFQHKRKHFIIGGLRGIRKSDDKLMLYEIFTLFNKTNHEIINVPNDIDESKIYQIDKVYINEEFRNKGLTTLIYKTLADRGYIVISDIYQYTGGVKFWKNLSKKIDHSKYKINVLNILSGYITKHGRVIDYNGSNISDDKIWTSDWNYEGKYLVLVLRTK